MSKLETAIRESIPPVAKPDWYKEFKAQLEGGVGERAVEPERDNDKRSVAVINPPKRRFDPNKHLSKVQGRDYLEVKWRLVWFRQDHPAWAVETMLVEINTEKQYAIFRAVVKDESGRVIASGTKVESRNGFADYLEKAETGAVGRALALCGYGTQFAPELEEGERVVDAPLRRE